MARHEMLYKLKCLKHRFIWQLSKRRSVSGSDLVQRWALDEVDGRLALFALQTQHVVGVTPAQNSRPLYVGAVHAPYTWETREDTASVLWGDFTRQHIHFLWYYGNGVQSCGSLWWDTNTDALKALETGHGAKHSQD